MTILFNTRLAVSIGVMFILAMGVNSAHAQIPSADCSTAAAQQATVNNACTPVPFNVSFAVGNPANPACLFGAGTGQDGWAWFFATAINTVISYNNTNRDAMLFIYADNGTPCAGLTEVACADDWGPGISTETVALQTVIGQRYYVRVVRAVGTSMSMTGTLCIYNNTAIPNDFCSTPTPVACGATINGNTSAASQDDVSLDCGDGVNVDPGVWYLFTGTGQNITASLCGSTYDTWISVFTGSCGGLTCYASVDQFCTDQSQVTFQSVAGVNYYILVHGFFGAFGAFTLNVDCTPLPMNDDCSGAVPITCGTSVNGETASYTTENIPNGCGFETANGVWYQFVGDDSEVTLTVCNGYSFDTQISVFTGGCGGLTCVTTNDDFCDFGSLVTFHSVAGEIYYVLILGSPDSQGSFNLLMTCADYEVGPDDCEGAFPICGDTQFNGNSSGWGDIDDLDATNQGCLSNGEHQSSWYVFSPTTTGTISFTINPTPLVDYDFAVWGPMSAVSCPVAGNPIRCSFSALIAPTGLNAAAADLSETTTGDGFVAPIVVAAGDVNQFYIMCLDNFSASTTPFVFDWTLGGGLVLNCDIQTPVELSAFTGKALPGANLLEWSTLSESMNEKFIVERSADNLNFKAIGEVAGAGNAQTLLSYSYTDKSPPGHTNYYRLRQVDYNGEWELSQTIAIQTESICSIAPNPADDQIQLTLGTFAANAAQFCLFDINGRTVKCLRITPSAEITRMVVDVKDMLPGLYQAIVFSDDGDQLVSGKIVISH